MSYDVFDRPPIRPMNRESITFPIQSSIQLLKQWSVLHLTELFNLQIKIFLVWVRRLVIIDINLESSHKNILGGLCFFYLILNKTLILNST